jgi:hypothetical protein
VFCVILVMAVHSKIPVCPVYCSYECFEIFKNYMLFVFVSLMDQKTCLLIICQESTEKRFV